MTKDRVVANRVVKAIMRDFTDRRGWRQSWDETDEQVKAEILRTWRDIVQREIGKDREWPERSERCPG